MREVIKSAPVPGTQGGGGEEEWLNAQCHFVVGGLLIGFSKSNSPKVRKMSESGRIIPLKKRIWG